MNSYLNYIQRQGQRRYLIAGDAGTIEWTTRDGQLRLYTSKGEKDRTLDARLADVNEMYVAQSRRVLDDLATGGAPRWTNSEKYRSGVIAVPELF